MDKLPLTRLLQPFLDRLEDKKQQLTKRELRKIGVAIDAIRGDAGHAHMNPWSFPTPPHHHPLALTRKSTYSVQVITFTVVLSQ